MISRRGTVLEALGMAALVGCMFLVFIRERIAPGLRPGTAFASGGLAGALLFCGMALTEWDKQSGPSFWFTLYAATAVAFFVAAVVGVIKLTAAL